MVPTKVQTVEKPRARGISLGPGGDGAFGHPGGGGDGIAPAHLNLATIGVWLLVGAITLLFAAFTSTLLARRGEADWHVGPLPPILWVNTLVLLLSSAGLEWARRGGRQEQLDRVRRGLAVTTALGVAFLVGQVIAWRQLVAAGVYLSTNPHSAFFYLLTGTHAVHVVGGVGALGYALWMARRVQTPAQALAVVDPTATYWHFVDGLWLYVFLILFWL